VSPDPEAEIRLSHFGRKWDSLASLMLPVAILLLKDLQQAFFQLDCWRSETSVT
jgi:hypothetical protein